MKKILVIILFLPLTSLFVVAQDIPPRPDPPKLVNDLGDMLSQQEETLLESKLVAYNDSTSTQIAVVIIESLEGNDVIDYAYRIGENWGVGQKGKNNGIVVLISKNDRESAIVSGYGMEGTITDAAASRIQRDHITPHFRNGNYYAGLDEATTVIMQMASGQYTNEGKPRGSKGPLGGAIVFFIILFFIVIPILSAVGRARRNHIGRKGLNFWTILWILSHMGGGRRGGGGGGWGGGGSGGGFGGFGGGSFGGGGARGSW